MTAVGIWGVVARPECYVLLNPKSDHHEDKHKVHLKFVSCTAASYTVSTGSYRLFYRLTSKSTNLMDWILKRYQRYNFEALSCSNVHSYITEYGECKAIQNFDPHRTASPSAER